MAFAWTPPAHLMRQWNTSYSHLMDLDAGGSFTTQIVVRAPSALPPGVGGSAGPDTGPSVQTAPVHTSSTIQQGTEHVVPSVQAPSHLPMNVHRHLTFIDQSVEEAPVQQFVYAPVSNTFVRAIQNVNSFNIFNILQQCGSLCTQFIDIDALAIAIGNQIINGSSSNVGTIFQNGTFSGSGSHAGTAQSMNISPSANTDVGGEMNAAGSNLLNALQVSGSGGTQAFGSTLGSFTFPNSLINAGSSNTTSATQSN